jgi:hypothetical protein
VNRLRHLVGFERSRGECRFEERGTTEIKGIGCARTFFLVGLA